MVKKALLATVPASLLVMTGPAFALLESDVITQTKQHEAKGQSFGDNLAREYRNFAIFENDSMWDYLDAEHFAKKAEAARMGRPVAPENIDDWDIKTRQDFADLSQGRARLVAALADDAATKAPQAAAVAQAKFDCWVEQEEENYQPAHIQACKEQFAAALSQLEARMGEASAEPAPPVTGQPAQQAMVFFDFDRSEVTSSASQVLGQFATQVEADPNVVLWVEGHADRSGPNDYNRRLSMQRAEAVRQELNGLGLPVGSFADTRIVAKGETDPLVETGDGVREPQNRRVTVRVVEQMQQSGMLPRTSMPAAPSVGPTATRDAAPEAPDDTNSADDRLTREQMSYLPTQPEPMPEPQVRITFGR